MLMGRMREPKIIMAKLSEMMSLNFCHLKGILSYPNKPLGAGTTYNSHHSQLGELLSSPSLNG